MMFRKFMFAKLALLAAAPAILSSPSARAGFDSNLYQSGHADLSVGYENGALKLFYEVSRTARVNGVVVGGTGIELSPSDTSVIVPESTLTTGDGRLPSPFANHPLHLLAQGSAGSATRPFLGFGADGVESGRFVGNTLSLTLTGFSSMPGGGQFILFATGQYSSPAMNTADGLSAADSISLSAGGHDHYNLGFTSAGIYDLTFTATGNLVGGGTLTATDTFRFVVGNQPAAVPEPSALAMAGLAVGCGALAAARGRRA